MLRGERTEQVLRGARSVPEGHVTTYGDLGVVPFRGKRVDMDDRRVDLRGRLADHDSQLLEVKWV